MLESHPPRSPGVIAGVLLVCALIALDVGLGYLLLSRPITFLSFILGLLLLATLPIIAGAGYLAQTLREARYHVDDDALIIDWGVLSQQIPLAGVRSHFLGTSASRVRRFRGVRWPGLFVGRGELETDGDRLPVRILAARGLAHQVVLVTDQGALAVSPADPESFQACIKGLRAMEVRQSAAAVTVPSELPGWRIGRDRLAQWLLFLPLPLNFALFAYLSIIFSRLPTTVPLRFDMAGIAVQTGDPLNLFLLPVLALFGWLGNAWLGSYFYRVRTERGIAILLWANSLGLQMAAWIGLLRLITG